MPSGTHCMLFLIRAFKRRILINVRSHWRCEPLTKRRVINSDEVSLIRRNIHGWKLNNLLHQECVYTYT